MASLYLVRILDNSIHHILYSDSEFCLVEFFISSTLKTFLYKTRQMYEKKNSRSCKRTNCVNYFSNQISEGTH